MIFGLRQAVMNGQISIDQINASVQRILEMKLHYKILTYNEAMQLIDNAE
jgi:beta-glucosidase-like glycosyl hydrolase